MDFYEPVKLRLEIGILDCFPGDNELSFTGDNEMVLKMLISRFLARFC